MNLCDVDPTTHVHTTLCDVTNCPDEAKMADDWANDMRQNAEAHMDETVYVDPCVVCGVPDSTPSMTALRGADWGGFSGRVYRPGTCVCDGCAYQFRAAT